MSRKEEKIMMYNMDNYKQLTEKIDSFFSEINDWLDSQADPGLIERYDDAVDKFLDFEARLETLIMYMGKKNSETN